MSKEDKFNPERLLRSLGFTSVQVVKDEKTGERKEVKNDWGTSRFYDHPLGYRVDITYDDDSARKPENVLYYMFRDDQHQFDLDDWLKRKKAGTLGGLSAEPLKRTKFDKDLTELNKVLREVYDYALRANPELQRYSTNFSPVTCAGFHKRELGTATKGHLSMEWWMGRFEEMGWDVDKMKENKDLGK